jgi:hypothetical protein
LRCLQVASLVACAGIIVFTASWNVSSLKRGRGYVVQGEKALENVLYEYMFLSILWGSFIIIGEDDCENSKRGERE